MTKSALHLELDIIGQDHGAGALKVFGKHGGVELPALVAADAQRQSHTGVAGLRQAKPPMRVVADQRRFYIGPGAHDWGRPIENLDDARFGHSPENDALWRGALSVYMQRFGPFDGPIETLVGLPQSAFAPDTSKDVIAGVRAAMGGLHHWQVENGSQVVEHQAEIAHTTVTSQAAGALFDYVLDLEGEFVPGRKAAFKQEVGVISLGMNTLEMLVLRDNAPVERFRTSETAGVRRLLELVDPAGLYSRGELDAQLRSGALPYQDALPVWAAEVIGHVERIWGRAFRRFAAITIVGGGALLLRDLLLPRFNGKAFVPDDPVMSVARGLYKLGRMRARRPRR